MKQKYEFIGKSVWIEKEKILVIADLHIGYEESLNIAMPRLQYSEIIKDLERIFKETKNLKEIIILGDLKHEFSKNITQEWNEVRKFFSFLKEKCEKVVLVKGNHDNFIENISSKYNIEVKDYYIKDEFGFIHGDKQFIEILDKKIKYLFLGHMHPAIRLEEGAKREIYKCFLRGKWKSKEIIILPSFFPFVEGTHISEDNNLAYDFKLKNFEVFIPDEEKILDFGKLKDIRKLA